MRLLSYHDPTATSLKRPFSPVADPIGVPATYAAILLYHRSKINRPGLERLSALEQRGADLTLRPISFLFATYTPEAYMFEVLPSPHFLPFVTIASRADL